VEQQQQPGVDEEDMQLCSICLADYQEAEVLKVLPCGHLHHKACISEWLRISATCPLCKAEVR
jgi:hypothetical protein